MPESGKEQQLYPNPRLGIRVSNFNDEVLQRVLRIYEEVAGVEAVDKLRRHGQDASQLLAKFKEHGIFEWRLGSGLSVHSKFIMKDAGRLEGEDLMRFMFDPNLDDDLDPQGLELVREYREKIEEYLTERGLGVSLKQ